MKYPCTVKHKGEYHIEYNPEGTLLSQRYRLNLSVKMGIESDSISFPVQLSFNGELVSLGNFQDMKTESEKIMDIDFKDLLVFYKNAGNSSYALGVTKFHLDANNYSPLVICYTGNVNPYKLFSPLNDIGVKLNCNAYWSLTKDIKVRLVHFDSKYAYHFNEIYHVINKKLQEMIIEKPKPH